uniref:Uncharacterized protein n=1 Tax=Romanomermis culicivorax TaxID=13658 RepID=A0A915JBF9_ROMCU
IPNIFNKRLLCALNPALTQETQEKQEAQKIRVDARLEKVYKEEIQEIGSTAVKADCAKLFLYNFLIQKWYIR